MPPSDAPQPSPQPASVDGMPSASVAPRRDARLVVRNLVLGIIAGALLGLLGMAAALVLLTEPPPPAVDEEALKAAATQWDRHGPPSYRMQLKLAGRQSGQIEVEVRDGEPVAVTRNGQPARPHTWDYWTVPGLLDIIRSDLDGVADPARAFGAPSGAEVVIQAEFDPALGSPTRYRRYIRGTDQDIAWEITRLEALP